ncbi:hypothetical protein PIB30_090548 [Stylosanthes scabra]|uniref:Uncharacterized protein n=1 Tax=Stylosanthes scabra TaxID=79078 RepID=A0ABU6QVF3_9FABA|nr:hypothetical protein [Stylosanthes scabra]
MLLSRGWVLMEEVGVKAALGIRRLWDALLQAKGAELLQVGTPANDSTQRQLGVTVGEETDNDYLVESPAILIIRGDDVCGGLELEGQKRKFNAYKQHGTPAEGHVGAEVKVLRM